MQWGVSMQRPRMVESKDLLDWEAEGLTTAEMQTRLADEGKTVSIELVRLRLREARQEAEGEPPTPPKARKDSATAQREPLLAEAVERLELLRDGLDAAVEGWGANFSQTARYETYMEASENLEMALDYLACIVFRDTLNKPA